jgi:hypothetical protein
MFELVDPKGIYVDVYDDKETAEEVARNLTELLGRKIMVRKAEVDSE